MSKIMKRYFSLLLVFVMVLTMLPVSARAEECAHENWGHKLKNSSGYFVIDSTYHGQTFYFSRVCVTCGAVIMDIDESQTYTKKEYHDIFYLDNFCLVCNYRPGSTHTHNYSTSSTETKREKLDDTYHNVVTTTTTKCSCGASGETSTSTVKEAHTFGEAKEVSSGNWQKTCTGCGATRKVEAPAQPGTSESTPAETKPAETTPPETKPTEPAPGETVPPQTHVHEFVYGLPEAEHPHYSYGYCSCGVGNTAPESLLSCCQCTGKHTWGYPVRLPDGSFKQNCTKCDASQTTTPSEGVKNYYKLIDMIKFRRGAAAKYQEEHGIDSATYAIWKTIAEQATDQLLDVDFVTTNETLNAIDSGVVGSIWDAVTEETWEEQQKEYWKTLMLEMLTSRYDVDELAAEQKTILDGTEVVSEALKLIENVTGDEMDRLTEKAEEYGTKLDVFTSSFHEYITSIDGSDQSGAPKSKIDELIENLKKNKETAKDRVEDKTHVNTWMKDLGLMMDFVGAAVEGFGDALITYQYNKTIIELGKNVENIDILQDIQESAAASGNTILANAAEELIQDIEKDMVNAVNALTSLGEGVLKFFTEFGLDVAKEFIQERLKGTIETVFTETSKYLDILSLGGTAMKVILGWGPAYDVAQQLMTINQMDATMNITQVLKEEDNPYMAELWGMLQAEGCAQAQVFLNEWEDGTGLSTSDLGIDDGGLFGESELPDVMNELAVERNYYITALKLPLEKSK